MFLSNMQHVIDTYVRPSAMLNVLSVEESLDLFQNIEKLVPVTRFVLNMVNSYEQNPSKLLNAELVCFCVHFNLNKEPNGNWTKSD